MVQEGRLMDAILVALHPRWAEAILSGAKTVEVRRRAMNVASGSLMVIYATGPVGQVIGLCRVDAVSRGPAEKLWERFGPRTALAHQDFLSYLAGSEATCLELEEPRTCSPRRLGFRPPQSWMRLSSENPAHRDLLSALP